MWKAEYKIVYTTWFQPSKNANLYDKDYKEKENWKQLWSYSGGDMAGVFSPLIPIHVP